MMITRPLLLILLGAMPSNVAAQAPSGSDTVVARVYWGEPLTDLLKRVSALVDRGFDARDVGRIKSDVLKLPPLWLPDSAGHRPLVSLHRVRFRGRTTPLKIVIAMTEMDIGYVDVGFHSPDSALLDAIRRQMHESYLTFVDPVDSLRLQVDERILMPGPAPHLLVTMETKRQYACLGYVIDHDFTQRRDTLRFEITGVPMLPRMCPAAMGPATLARRLLVSPGRYVLLVHHRDMTDEFRLDVTDSSTALETERSSFVTADERLRWRHPSKSFILSCGNRHRTQTVCDDIAAWLAQLPGVRRVTFTPGGLNPYRPEAGANPDEYAVVFRYQSEAVLERMRRCFAEIETQIRGAVGVFATVHTWHGEEMRAWSRQAFHEPHIPVPEKVTNGRGCSEAR